MKILLIVLVSLPLTYTNAGIAAEGSEPSIGSADDHADRQDSPTDSSDSPADKDKESTSSEPTPVPSISDRIATNDGPELTARTLQYSRHDVSQNALATARPNHFSSTSKPQQASLLRLAHIPSSDMTILATLDQAHAPPLS